MFTEEEQNEVLKAKKRTEYLRLKKQESRDKKKALGIKGVNYYLSSKDRETIDDLRKTAGITKSQLMHIVLQYAGKLGSEGIKERFDQEKHGYVKSPDFGAVFFEVTQEDRDTMSTLISETDMVRPEIFSVLIDVLRGIDTDELKKAIKGE